MAWGVWGVCIFVIIFDVSHLALCRHRTLSVVENSLGHRVTIICRFRHVVVATIYFLAERWSGPGRDDFFELRDCVLAEGIPCLAIGELLCVPTFEDPGIYSARLVELDEVVRYEVRVIQFLSGFEMRQKEHLDFPRLGPEYDFERG